MTPEELRELDAWIGEHLFDEKRYVGLVKRGLWYRPGACGYTSNESEAGRWLIGDALKLTDPNGDEPVTVRSFSTPRYTTDPAAAMEVLKKCAEKLSEHWAVAMEWQPMEGKWRVVQSDKYKGIEAEATTLELAIALFAKALFQVKPTT